MDPLSVAGTGANLLGAIGNLFAGRTGDQIAVEIAQKIITNARAVAIAGDNLALQYLGTKAGILPPFKVTRTFNYYDSSDKDYAKYQAVVGSTIGPAQNPVTQPYFANAYNELVNAGLGVNLAAGLPKLDSNATIGQARNGDAGQSGAVLASIIPAGAADSVKNYAPLILLGITALWALKYAKKLR